MTWSGFRPARNIGSGELSFKVVRLEPGGQICKAAFDKALFVYPTQQLRQGLRVICKAREV